MLGFLVWGFRVAGGVIQCSCSRLFTVSGLLLGVRVQGLFIYVYMYTHTHGRPCPLTSTSNLLLGHAVKLRITGLGLGGLYRSYVLQIRLQGLWVRVLRFTRRV